MNELNLDKLAALIELNREALLARWREQVRELPVARNLSIPTLNDHIPLLLDELVTALKSHDVTTIAQALQDGSSSSHGLQRVEDLYDIEEVVAEYNILRGCIHHLADANGLSLKGPPIHICNRVLDGAIGLAVQTYATRQALEVQHRREEYLAFVAHDLRTPLNAISLSAKVLEVTLLRDGAEGEIPRILKALNRNVQHLSELVRKILDENANLQTETGVKLQRRAFDLWPLVESLIHDLHPVSGTASTQLINEVPDELVVYADASLLTRAFQNLIANAIKYTPRGQVIIGARELGEKGGVECWVSDNGIGISEDYLAKIFDKGETDSHSAGGMGLGLAIVKMFVEAHGGSVSVKSKESAGTTLRFSLPGRSVS